MSLSQSCQSVDLNRYESAFKQRKRSARTIAGYASSLRTCGSVVIENWSTKFNDEETFPLHLEEDGSARYVNHPLFGRVCQSDFKVPMTEENASKLFLLLT